MEGEPITKKSTKNSNWIELNKDYISGVKILTVKNFLVVIAFFFITILTKKISRRIFYFFFFNSSESSRPLPAKKCPPNQINSWANGDRCQTMLGIEYREFFTVKSSRSCTSNVVSSVSMDLRFSCLCPYWPKNLKSSSAHFLRPCSTTTFSKLFDGRSKTLPLDLNITPFLSCS